MELAEGTDRFLSDLLGEIPFGLYAAEGRDSFRLCLDTGLNLDPRDPWSLELTAARLWRALNNGELRPLPVPPERADLTAPDPALRLRAVRDGGRLSGGLVVRLPQTRVAAALRERLQGPLLEGVLALRLELVRSQRRQKELLRFRLAVAAALPYGFLAVDALGRVTYAGGRASEILGLSEEELLGSDCARVFRPVGLGSHPLLDGLRRLPHPLELYVARPDGREVPVSLQMTRLPGKGGDGKSLVAFFQDVSEERALEDAERQRDRLAVLGELSAGVAHEIRNPLTGIANCAQVLSEALEPEDSHQRFLKIILDETARLNRIVEGLLSYARPNRPELREAALEDSVRRAIELLRPGLEEKGIRVTFRLSGRIPRTFVDPAQIEQVLLNLLRNAEQAMPSGGELGVEMSVIRRRAHRRRGPGRRATDRVRRGGTEGPLMRFVQVRVSDTGHGIPKELLIRVFNPFFTTRARGTGLGLSLSQSIVREHGGFLTIHSVEGKGTAVHLDLPVERRQGERRKEPR